MNIVIVITAACIVALVAERLIVSRRVKGIRIRIHVNGTRGKSSVARYIGAILSSSGMSTMVKITGIVPTIILPDGTAQPIVRRGGARVQEQFSVIARAVAHHAEALVLECMSLKPEYQQLETRIFRPHITVITNIGEDHREEMGETNADRIEAITGSIPYHATVVSIPGTGGERLSAIAEQRGTRVIMAPPLPKEFNDRLPESMFPVNVALALSVAGQLGISQERAFEAIRQLDAETGPVTATINNQIVRFFNGFAVNDVPSAERFLQRYGREEEGRERIIILNTRNDRPLRTGDFLAWCSSMKELHHLFITGTHASYAVRSLKKSGIPAGRIRRIHSEDLHGVLRETVRKETDIFGFGNIAGDGFAIIGQWTQKAAQQHGD